MLKGIRKIFKGILFIFGALGQATSFGQSQKTLGVVIFPNFELLDVFGPLEMFGSLPDKYKIILIAEKKGPVQSAQGPSVIADADFKTATKLNLILVPGGQGTRQEVHNQKLLTWLKERSRKSDLTLSVCTGAALLAKAGILDNRKATSNKLAFTWVTEQGPAVKWVKEARWVDDGNIITSSGIAAGIDMSLHVIDRMYGKKASAQVAKHTEYIWNNDPNHDPFA